MAVRANFGTVRSDHLVRIGHEKRYGDADESKDKKADLEERRRSVAESVNT